MTERVTGNRLQSIFISYARVDGLDMAQMLHHRLTDTGFSAWLDIERIKYGEVWYRAIEEGIENCATLILCLTAGALESKIVLQEWTLARQLGKRIILIKAKNLEFGDIPEVFRKFNWVNDLDVEWDNFIGQLKEPYITQPYPRASWMTLRASENKSHPVLVDKVPRLDLMSKIKSLLLKRKSAPKRFDSRKPPMVIALIGAGGQGKTTLAEAVMADTTVQMAFDAGFGLVKVEFEADDLEAIDKRRDKLAALIGHLSGNPKGISDDMIVLNRQLSDAINNDFCLILLDNVWDAALLDGFMVEGERHVYLITTRNHEVADQLGILQDRRISVGDMTEEEAIAVLSRDYNAQEVADLKENFHKLAWLLSCHPLSLELGRAMIQAMHHRDPRLAIALALTEELYHAEGFAGLDREKRIQATIKLSIDALDDSLRKKFFSFALLKDNIPVRLAVYALYWGGNVQSAVDACVALHKYSLLTYESDTIRFHDVLFEYLKTQASEQKRLHQTFLNAINPHRRLPWHALGLDDEVWAYVEDQLVYHLEEAGEIDAIHSLFESKHWAVKRDVFGLFRDYRRAKRLATNDATRIRYLFFDEVIQKQYPDAPVEVVIELIRRRQLSDEAAGVLAAAIKGMSGDNAAKLDAYVKTIPALPKEMHADVLAEALKFLKEESLPPETAANALKDLMAMLPPKTDLTDWLTVYWDRLLKIETRENRDPHINYVLGLKLSEAQKNSILTTTLELLKGDRYERVSDGNIKHCISILETLLSAYPSMTRDSAWQRVIDVLKEMSPYSSRENLWVQLLPLLPKHLQDACGEMVWEVLRDLMQWERSEFFEDIFVHLIKYLPEERIDSALERAKKEKESWGSVARSHLLRLQGDKGVRQTDEKIEEIQSETEDYQEYSGLPHLIGRLESLLMDDDTAKNYDKYQALWDDFVSYVHSQTKDDINVFDGFTGYFPPEILVRLWDDSIHSPRMADRPTEHLLLGLTGLIPYVDVERAEAFFWLRIENNFRGEHYPSYLSKILARFAKRLNDGQKLQLWDTVMEKFGETKDWQRQFPVVELYGQLSKENQQLKSEQVRTFINNISDTASRVRLICKYLKDNATENNKILWWIALEDSLKERFSPIGGVIGLLPFFYSTFDEDELKKLKNIDWYSKAWEQSGLHNSVVNSIEDFYWGLGLFILNAPKGFFDKTAFVYVRHGSCPALIALAVTTHLSKEDEDREIYIRRSVEKYRESGQQMEELYRLPTFLKQLSEKQVLGLWKEICELYKSAEEKFKYLIFVRCFIQVFPSPKLFEIARMALRNEAPTDKPALLLQSIVKLLTSEDTVIAIQLWREIEEYEKTLESSYEAREYRTARMMLIPLLPDGVLFQSIKARPILRDGLDKGNSFTYRLDRYFREPLLESKKYTSRLAEGVNRLREDGHGFHATAFGLFLFISTSLSYLKLPLMFLYQVMSRFLKTSLTGIVRLLRLDRVAKTINKTYENLISGIFDWVDKKYVPERERRYNSYEHYPIYFKILFLLISLPYFIKNIPYTIKSWSYEFERRRYGYRNRWDKFLLFVVLCKDAFISLFLSHDCRYHVSFYSISHKRAREILESMIAKKESALEFAKRRSLLQRLGGCRLRCNVGQAYHHSVTWWDEVTRRTIEKITPRDSSQA